MNKIPTAKEYLKQLDEESGTVWTEDDESICQALKEFAKLHVNACKEELKKELEEGLETFGISLTDDFKLEQSGNCLINNTYPDERIQ